MKIGIVGTGLVGSTTAYALVLHSIVNEIVLIDKDHQRARAESADILHAVPFTQPADIYAGDYSDLKDSKIVIITAGASQKPGESRLQLLDKNAAIFKNIIPQILKHASNTILLIATNPVDIMTHLAAQIATEFGIPATHVIGSGTTLDTARFRALLGNRLKVDPQHVHGYVIGEHGDSEVLTWSIVDIGGLPLNEFLRLRKIELDKDERCEIDGKVRQAAYHIIEGKGATYYGIAAALARIVDVIVHDHKAILTICTPMKEIANVADVTLSLPHLVSGQGVIDTLPLQLNQQENNALQKSARIIKNFIEQYEKS